MNTPKTITTRPEGVYGYAAEIKLKDGSRQWRVYHTPLWSVAAKSAWRVAGLREVVRLLPLTPQQYEIASANLLSFSKTGGIPRQQIYGHAVDIEMPTGRIIRKYWEVKRSLAMQLARLVPGAVRIIQCVPLTKEQWDAASGKQPSTTVNNRQPR